MKIEKTFLEDHQVQLSVEVDEETFDVSKRKAARKIARSVKIPGFRPGKAPYPVVVRQVGEGAVIEEALEFLVDDIYPRLIEDEELTPYGPGQLKEVKSLNPPELEFVIPLAPEVTLGDYRAIQIEYVVPEVTEEDIDQTLENLRTRQAKTEPVDRAAEAGDMLYITLHGHEKGDEKEKLIVDLHSTPVIIEADDADVEKEWPFPGFSNSLKGVEKGATKELEFEYAEDYDQDENLKGKAVVFHVTVEDVRSYDPPELDDAFAKTVGDYEDLAALREDARKQIEASKKDNYDSDFRNDVLDRIVAEAAFKYPPQMVEDEIDGLVDNFKNRLANEGWNLEDYLKVNQKEEAELRAEFQDTAIRRIHRGLAIMEIAEKEEIKVDPNEIEMEVQRTVNMVNSSFSPTESRKILNQDFLRGLASSAMRDALNDRTFARLKAIASGIEEEDVSEAADEMEDVPESEAETADGAAADTEAAVPAEEPVAEVEAEAVEGDASEGTEPAAAAEAVEPAESKADDDHPAGEQASEEPAAEEE